MKLVYETKRIGLTAYQYTEKLCGNIRRLLIASCKTAKGNDDLQKKLVVCFYFACRNAIGEPRLQRSISSVPATIRHRPNAAFFESFS